MFAEYADFLSKIFKLTYYLSFARLKPSRRRSVPLLVVGKHACANV